MFTMALNMVQKGDGWPDIINFTPHFIINFFWAATAFYLFYFYFIRYFEKRKFVVYLVFSVTISMAVTFAFLPIHKLFLHSFTIFNFRIFGPPIAGTFIIVQCGSLVRGFESWFTNIQLKAELENQNLKNELELLKSQVNPHFLFNTLNNIDSLIHSVPENASASLITLSDMLRYMIYETGTDTVPLVKEITHLKNYISLQQLRYRNPSYIRFTYPENCQNTLIAPMLFIPFVENAFKFSSDKGTYPVIDISVVCDEKSVSFYCLNYFQNENKPNKLKGGVGLSNVKRRLELLYPGKFTLTILNESPVFTVDLKIVLV